ncbi:MAG: glycosyltransferase [Alphaproteobacteria bacterium]|nr:glycosyltransferase [Alphaproteobacteria bacterium]
MPKNSTALLTIAVACTSDDYLEFCQYWSDLGNRLDARIHLLLLVQSPDSTHKSLANRIAPGVKVVFRQRLGLSRARNDCIKLCRTRWIWMMDADSTLSDPFLLAASLNDFFGVLEQHHAVVFMEGSRFLSWQSAVQNPLFGASLKRLTSLRSPNLIFDVDFARSNAIQFSLLLGKNSRFRWPRHGEEFAFAVGMALCGARMVQIEYSPITALRPSTGATIGTLEKYAALNVIAGVIALDLVRAKLTTLLGR